MQPQPGKAQRLVSALRPTLHYWMQTEVHVFAFSIAANVLLSFFPFLIVSISLSSVFLNQQTTLAVIKVALQDYFPDALGNFVLNNLPNRRPVALFSMVLLLFTSNGIFEPLEVALNHIWGIRQNRSFLRNQLVSLGLMFVCGTLALLSLGLPAMYEASSSGGFLARTVAKLGFKLGVIPLTCVILLLVYRFLPNGRPPWHRLIPAAIGVGVLLEALKALNILWPWFDERLAREYGAFKNSVTLIFLSFMTSMLVLAGAEWAARGHKLDMEK
jgi:YihY family inner membrane protein